MRKWILVLMAMAIGAAACDGGKGDDDDDGGSAGFLVDANVGGGNNGEQALVRFRGGAPACVEGTVAGAAVTLSGGGLTIGDNYNVIELFVNQDGNNTWDPADDLAWTHTAIVPTNDVILTLDAGDPAATGWTLSTSLTWATGTACPGT